MPEPNDTWTTAHIHAGRVACYRLATEAAENQQYIKARALANLAENYPLTSLALWATLMELGVPNASHIIDRINRDYVDAQAYIEQAAKVDAARSRGRTRNR